MYIFMFYCVELNCNIEGSFRIGVGGGRRTIVLREKLPMQHMCRPEGLSSSPQEFFGSSES